MKANHLRLIGFGLILIGSFMLLGSARKTVTIQINGQNKTVTTLAVSVRDALKQEKILIAPADRLWPVPDQRLEDGDTIRFEQAARVTIWDGSRQYQIESSERRPANLLALAGLGLYPGDQILMDGAPVSPAQLLPRAAAYRLRAMRAIRINLQAGDASQILYTTAPTFGQALAEIGLELRASDHFFPPLDTPLQEDLTAELTPSIDLSIQDQGGSIQVRSAAPNVGEALAENGLTLVGLDYSQPAADQPLPQDGQIRVVRVVEQVSIEQEPLAFDTELQPAPEVELDTQTVLQPGEFGLLARRVRTRIENGEEVSQKVESEWVARQPKNRIVGYGTKVVLRTLNTPDGPIQYWRVVTMYATSYSPCRIFKDRCDSYTASGATLKKGIAAMTGQWYYYTGGDQVYVPDYGIATVADTGGGIPGRYWIDLGYSEEDYVSWHQYVSVYFLAPVPSQIMWVLP
jgi:resuscitation-promoting factor RpfB